MNFKNQIKKLEKCIEEEFKNSLPITILPDGNIVYKHFFIKKNNQGKWQLTKPRTDPLDTFNSKSCALIAAKLYETNNFEYYSELKILDEIHERSRTEYIIYKKKYQKNKNPEKTDVHAAKYLKAKGNLDYSREKIINKFRLVF
jgi:hypothetical protein